MENNQKRQSCPTKDVCEKIYRAITVSSPIRTIHRISSRQHESSRAKVANPSRPTSDAAITALDPKTKPVENAKQLRPKAKQGSEVTPVKFDYRASPANSGHQSPSSGPGKEQSKSKANLNNPGIQVTKVALKIETPTSATSVQDKHKPGTPRREKIAPVQVIKEDKPAKHIEDRFTEYINRAKLRIRSMSNVGDEQGSPVADVGHKDHFSDYIRRAKLKLRTTSSIKVKSESFKGAGKEGA